MAIPLESGFSRVSAGQLEADFAAELDFISVDVAGKAAALHVGQLDLGTLDGDRRLPCTAPVAAAVDNVGLCRVDLGNIELQFAGGDEADVVFRHTQRSSGKRSLVGTDLKFDHALGLELGCEQQRDLGPGDFGAEERLLLERSLVDALGNPELALRVADIEPAEEWHAGRDVPRPIHAALIVERERGDGAGAQVAIGEGEIRGLRGQRQFAVLGDVELHGALLALERERQARLLTRVDLALDLVAAGRFVAERVEQQAGNQFGRGTVEVVVLDRHDGLLVAGEIGRHLERGRGAAAGRNLIIDHGGRRAPGCGHWLHFPRAVLDREAGGWLSAAGTSRAASRASRPASRPGISG